MLSWFIQYFPTSAQWYVGEIMGEADKYLDIPAQVTGEALRRSAITNGNLDAKTVEEFFSPCCRPVRAGELRAARTLGLLPRADHRTPAQSTCRGPSPPPPKTKHGKRPSGCVHRPRRNEPAAPGSPPSDAATEEVLPVG
ncbi:hypothetical protein GCM10010451_38740 [Streptomyces virens]|uniref:Uncharacterized protein n=1 Tax=Streptomyces virens TaxID=285572 RepID=A0ABP6PQE8_9ACTN